MAAISWNGGLAKPFPMLRTCQAAWRKQSPPFDADCIEWNVDITFFHFQFNLF